MTYSNFSDDSPEELKKALIGYRQSFFINGFLELTGTLFFLSHGTLTKRVQKERDELMDEYIAFCKLYGKLIKI